MEIKEKTRPTFAYLIVYDDASVILEIEEGTIFPPESLPLTDDDSRHH